MVPKRKEDEGLTRLAKVLSERMDERGMTITQLASRVDLASESVRRYVRGMTQPSRFALKAICAELKLPYKELLDLRQTDKIFKEFGKTLPASLVNKKPGLDPIERVWDDLTPEHQNDAIGMILGWAKRDRLAKE